MDRLSLNATQLRRLHLGASILWALNFPLLLIASVREAVAYVAFCSVYANFVGHLSSWQASRAEELVDPEIDTAGR